MEPEHSFESPVTRTPGEVSPVHSHWTEPVHLNGGLWEVEVQTHNSLVPTGAEAVWAPHSVWTLKTYRQLSRPFYTARSVTILTEPPVSHLSTLLLTSHLCRGPWRPFRKLLSNTLILSRVLHVLLNIWFRMGNWIIKFRSLPLSPALPRLSLFLCTADAPSPYSDT
jgi:hypothetical protein